MTPALSWFLRRAFSQTLQRILPANNYFVLSTVSGTEFMGTHITGNDSMKGIAERGELCR